MLGGMLGLVMLLLGVARAEELPGEDAGAGAGAVKKMVQDPLPTPPVGAERWLIPQATLAAVRAAAGMPLGERMDAATRGMLGAIYLNNLAGEGRGVDPDPPARYDAFDCMTLIEEAMGLAISGDPISAPMIRNQLRYDLPTGDSAEISYERRRHFMESQWIPAAIQNGILEDITGTLGPARWIRRKVVEEDWKTWKKRSLFRLPVAAFPTGTWALPYLSLDDAAAAIEKIPEGAIVFTTRTERAWHPIVIMHVGVLVREEGQPPLMRHASRMGKQVVRQDSLQWYIDHLRSYKNWPVAGLTILMPRDRGPRMSRLPPAVQRQLRGETATEIPAEAQAGLQGAGKVQ